MPGKKASNVAFIISHSAQQKLYRPIVEGDHGRSFTIFHKTIKEDIELKKSLESNGHKYRKYTDDNNLIHILEIERVNILITENIGNVLLKDIMPKLQVFYLQHSHDIVSYIPQKLSIETLSKVDKFLLFSDYWKECFIDSLEEKFKDNLNEVQHIREKTIAVGFPEIEQIKNFSKQDILKKFNIESSKEKIIFFDPIGTVNHVGNVFYGYFFKLHGSFLNKIKIFGKQFFYDIFHHPLKTPKILFLILKLCLDKKFTYNYQSLLLDLRDYCDKNNAMLVVKSREKNNDPDYIKILPDIYTHDLEFYPFTLLELLFVSDLYIGFNSTTTIEAVASATNAMQINVCPKKYQYHDYGEGIYSYLDLQLSTKFSWNNYPGIVNVIDHNTPIKHLIVEKDFKIDENLQKAYIKKFLIDLDNSSSRLMSNIFNENE